MDQSANAVELGPVDCRFLRDHARTIAGKSQLFINAYAKALEIIPRQLCDNAGFDATDVLNKLRQKHAVKSQEGQNFGVDVNTGKQPHESAFTKAQLTILFWPAVLDCCCAVMQAAYNVMRQQVLPDCAELSIAETF